MFGVNGKLGVIVLNPAVVEKELVQELWKFQNQTEEKNAKEKLMKKTRVIQMPAQLIVNGELGMNGRPAHKAVEGEKGRDQDRKYSQN